MVEGIILGFMTYLSFMLSWWHLPPRIKTFMTNHPVLSDITAGALAMLLLTSISKSIVAVVGSMTTGLLVNFTIMAYHQFKDE